MIRRFFVSHRACALISALLASCCSALMRAGAAPDSDYDLILVADHFRGVPRSKRQLGLRRLFYAVGGHAPMDLICLTPEEFDAAAHRDTLVASVLPHALDLLPEAEHVAV